MLQHKMLFIKWFELLLMAWWWFATSSFSGTSSGPGWNLSFLVWVWKNWPNNESGMFFGITILCSCLWLCLWGAFTGSTLRPVNGSISSHCWGLKIQKAVWARGKPKVKRNLKIISDQFEIIMLHTLQNDAFFHNHNWETF